ncbi:MAG: gamma-glutamyl-gamma-aminobutyrate hydrolase family protein [Pseudomonadota bacterium]
MILIVEGNAPSRVAQGHTAADAFVRTFMALGEASPLRVVQPDVTPLNIGDFDGVRGAVFTGAGNAWSTDAPEAAAQRAAVDTALEAGVPIWGSCNGLNLIACVLGGTVGACALGLEVGLASDLRLTDGAGQHPMMAGRADGFAVPCIHRDGVMDLPAGAQVLAGNAHHPVQAMVYEQGGARVWATQYHPEFSLADIAALVRERQGLYATHGSQAQDMSDAACNPEAAGRLGTTPDAQAVPTRALELRNWLRTL